VNHSLTLSPVQEYSAHLENIILRLMIDSPEAVLLTPTDPFLPLHDHVASELFVCDHGEMTLKTEQGHITLHAGDAAVIPPRLPHATCFVAPGALCYAICFLIQPRSVRGCADLAAAFRPITHGKQVLLFHHQHALFAGVQTILQQQNRVFPFLHAANMASHLLSALAQGYDTADSVPSSTAAPPRPGGIQRLAALDQIIERCYMRNDKMEDIARQLFISSRQLGRTVRQRYGKTLRQMFFDRRILEAERLLLTTDMSLSQIAASVGFGSAAIFSREFRQRRNMSPAQFRKENAPPTV